ncbi:hypothetical protein DEO72_LG11g1751 [Vigna unguiculata]|uniref:Uncharacterized protein n=1 Tax=Vigna unguiculata TaxID=3917 RepID=A0A4D6NM74_VIGUN|nr:hypothetical protein DEO72_LG11g1751 [Vigna unguiculata]
MAAAAAISITTATAPCRLRLLPTTTHHRQAGNHQRASFSLQHNHGSSTSHYTLILVHLHRSSAHHHHEPAFARTFSAVPPSFSIFTQQPWLHQLRSHRDASPTCSAHPPPLHLQPREQHRSSDE